MDLEFLDGETPEPEAMPAPEAQETSEAAPESTGPQRGADGKFISAAQNEPAAEPAPEPALQAQSPQQPEAPPEVGGIMKAMLDEREKRQALEAQLRQYQQALAQQQAQPEPDPNEDWQGWVSHQQQMQQQAVISAKVQLSEEMAVDKYGEELVRAADAWALTKARELPGFQEHILSQRHPYGFVVQQYQREQALGKLQDPGEIDQYLAWKAAQAQATAAAPQPAAPPQAAPPRSLAGLPSAGSTKPGEVPLGEDALFKTLF
jgi:hypothetical protein